MPFVLGAKSRTRLEGVHPDLIKLVEHAIGITPVDFTVLEGLRSEARQRQLVEAGASQTMNSRHLTGHAIDLGALLRGKVSWDWPLYYQIADAMVTSAKTFAIHINWGGVWDKDVLDFTEDAENEMGDYVARRRAAGRRAFTDGPHFQLTWEHYPV